MIEGSHICAWLALARAVEDPNGLGEKHGGRRESEGGGKGGGRMRRVRHRRESWEMKKKTERRRETEGCDELKKERRVEAVCVTPKACESKKVVAVVDSKRDAKSKTRRLS